MELWSRRKFFLTSLAGSTLAGANKIFGRTPSNGDGGLSLENPAPPSPGKPAATGKRPLLISSANGLHALDKGMDILQKGGDTLDAVVAVVTVVEDDPNDDSVGYGGLPNEEGEVELDASVMHGPTHRAGAVAAVRTARYSFSPCFQSAVWLRSLFRKSWTLSLVTIGGLVFFLPTAVTVMMTVPGSTARVFAAKNPHTKASVPINRARRLGFAFFIIEITP